MLKLDLTSAEFSALRESIGLRSIQLARLMQISPTTVSRWERADDPGRIGAMRPPRSAALVLHLLRRLPERERLALYREHHIMAPRELDPIDAE